MAILIDSLHKLDHRVRRKFKKAFERLSDDFKIRTPVLDQSEVAQLLIEGPNHAWLFISYSEQIPDQIALEKYLLFTAKIAALQVQQTSKQVSKQTSRQAPQQEKFKFISYLAVTDEGETLFDSKDPSVSNLQVIAKDRFFAHSSETISEYLSPVSRAQHAWIKKELIAETAIHVACSTRRYTQTVDNSAHLDAFFLDYNQEIATKLDIFESLPEHDYLSEQEHIHEQEHLAEKKRSPDDDDIPVRLINGVSGSGKTLILINRAILYCRKYPQRRVLLLIHNKPITADIQHKFKAYLNGCPAGLTIKTFHAFALAQQKRYAVKTSPLFGASQLAPYQQKIIDDHPASYRELNLSHEQVWSELEYINDYLIDTKETYLNYDRQGRVFPLQQAQREHIWIIYEDAMALFSQGRDCLPSWYIRNLCLLPEAQKNLDKYEHILLDETQFFFPSWLQLVKNSLQESGTIFMCADPNQGFLKSRLSWKSVGLNVRGRTKKLHYSYRTTLEILSAANALIAHMGENNEDFITPDFNNMLRGSKPIVIISPSPQDELTRFLNELADCVTQGKVPLDQILVLCHESIKPWDLKKRIEQRLGLGTVLNCNDRGELSGDLTNKIRVVTMNSCTGMESGTAFVLGVGELLHTAKRIGLSDAEAEQVHQATIRKLYVAMTRAGQKLVMFSTQKFPGVMRGLVTEA